MVIVIDVETKKKIQCYGLLTWLNGRGVSLSLNANQNNMKVVVEWEGEDDRWKVQAITHNIYHQSRSSYIVNWENCPESLRYHSDRNMYYVCLVDKDHIHCMDYYVVRNRWEDDQQNASRGGAMRSVIDFLNITFITVINCSLTAERLSLPHPSPTCASTLHHHLQVWVKVVLCGCNSRNSRRISGA